MSEEWKPKAAAIGKIILDLAGIYPEIDPLAHSYLNFSRKYSVEGSSQAAAMKSRRVAMGVNPKRLRTALAAFDKAGLVVIDREDYEKLVKVVDRQSEEIDALELRIKRLSERH